MVLNIPAIVSNPVVFADLPVNSFFAVQLLNNWHVLYKKSINTVSSVHGDGIGDCLLKITKSTECYPLTLGVAQAIGELTPTVECSGIEFEIPESLG